jgi:chloramphenicol-sensitive protein RarD
MSSGASLGGLYAALAFVFWGLFPLYFRLIAAVPATEVLVHRIVWSALLLVIVLTARRHWQWLRALRHQPRVVGAFMASAMLLSMNWLVYTWAVTHDHVLDASLGYFINPLINVLLGFTVLHERLRRLQWAALAFAAAGVLWLTLLTGRPPWISLILATSFGIYGLLRKIAVLGPLEGLSLETLLLAPLACAAAAFWWHGGTLVFPAADATMNALLIASGPLTTLPLLLFAAGARRVSLTTLGLLQYIAPTLQLLLGVWLFHEPFPQERVIGFSLIWVALVIYSAEGWWTNRRTAAAVARAAA